MFKTSNLFALLGIFVLTGVIANGQTSAPKKEPALVERTIEVISDGVSFSDGGSYLGVETQEVTKENFSKFGLREVRGVAIEKVLDESPAKLAGLQDGDVIVRFNGEEVSNYRKLTRLISETAPDHQAKITVLRGGNEREVTVTLGKRQMPKFEMGNFEFAVPTMPSMPRMPSGVFERAIPFPDGDSGMFVWQGDGKDGNFVFGSTRQIGVGVTGLTKQLGNHFGVSDGKGILINDVKENSPAAKAGLKAGDVITEVEGKSVSNTMELIRGISEKKEGDVTLTIVRDRNRQTVKVTPEKMKESEMSFRVFSQPSGSFMRSIPKVRVAPSSRLSAPSRVRTITRIL